MKNMLKVGFLSLILILGITGCGSAKVMNVSKQSIIEKKTHEDIFSAIKTAGAGLGWIVRKTSDNTAVATLNLRSHQAVVAINFSQTDYSINYKASIDLDYNEEEYTIHSNYNGWIQNLNNAIQVQLSL